MRLGVRKGGGPHHAGGGGGTGRHRHASGGGSGSGGSSSLNAATILAALQNDPTVLQRLSDAVASELFSGGFTAQIISAIEAVMQTGQTQGPGRRLAGVVSTLSGNIQGGLGGASPMTAMVYVGGAANAAPCYVPSHLAPDIAGGQDVWVEPINGSTDDLMITAIRNYTATPVASQALANAATAQAAATTNNVYWLASAYQVLNSSSIAPSVGVTQNYWTNGSGVPSGAKAVYLYAIITSATVGAYLCAQPGTSGTLSSHYFAVGNIQVASQFCNGSGWVPLDAAGNLSIEVGGGGSNNASVTLYVLGYSK